MADKYGSFEALKKSEHEGRDFKITFRKKKSAFAVMAPHGGGIEPGTSEIADAIAGDDLSFYAFEGTKSKDNKVLHVTSSNFSEPECRAIAASSQTVIAIHGEGSEETSVFLGGLDSKTGDLLRRSLEARGFTVCPHPEAHLQGVDSGNICNRGKTGAGVQLELPKGLRKLLFEGLDREGRTKPTKRFEDFIVAIRESCQTADDGGH